MAVSWTYTCAFGGDFWFRKSCTAPVVYPQKDRLSPRLAPPGVPPTMGVYALSPQGCEWIVMTAGAARTEAASAPSGTMNLRRRGGEMVEMRRRAQSNPTPAKRQRNGYAVIQCLVPPKIGVALESHGA